jgi:hypothetical protein
MVVRDSEYRFARVARENEKSKMKIPGRCNTFAARKPDETCITRTKRPAEIEREMEKHQVL